MDGGDYVRLVHFQGFAYPLNNDLVMGQAYQGRTMTMMMVVVMMSMLISYVYLLFGYVDRFLILFIFCMF